MNAPVDINRSRITGTTYNENACVANSSSVVAARGSCGTGAGAGAGAGAAAGACAAAGTADMVPQPACETTTGKRAKSAANTVSLNHDTRTEKRREIDERSTGETTRKRRVKPAKQRNARKKLKKKKKEAT